MRLGHRRARGGEALPRREEGAQFDLVELDQAADGAATKLVHDARLVSGGSLEQPAPMARRVESRSKNPKDGVRMMKLPWRENAEPDDPCRNVHGTDVPIRPPDCSRFTTRTNDTLADGLTLRCLGGGPRRGDSSHAFLVTLDATRR